ncbi:hypothetical protein LAY57_09070 [Argonema antarcticum A004/B2]|nr:hypothetical protein [Argonema antarcticum A004/B2]
MKGKSLLSFGLSLAIFAGGCLPVLAESQQEATKQSRQTVQRLPNGNYFYGKSRLPNQQDVDYLAFRKTGNTVIGFKYRYREEGYCLRGTVNGNTVNNVTREYVELGLGSRPEFRRGSSINLATFNKLNYNQIPGDSNVTRRLEECVRLFSNRM